MTWAPLNIAYPLTQPRPTLDLVLPGLPVGTVGNLVAAGATGKTQFFCTLLSRAFWDSLHWAVYYPRHLQRTY